MRLKNFIPWADIWLNDWSFFITISFERDRWQGDWSLGIHILCFYLSLDYVNQ